MVSLVWAREDDRCTDPGVGLSGRLKICQYESGVFGSERRISLRRIIVGNIMVEEIVVKKRVTEAMIKCTSGVDVDGMGMMCVEWSGAQ